VVAVTPAFINNCPAPRLKTVAILRAGFSGTSVAEESELKLPEVMTVDEIDRFAVTVPLDGRERTDGDAVADCDCATDKGFSITGDFKLSIFIITSHIACAYSTNNHHSPCR
jgi:hypothetical protein